MDHNYFETELELHASGHAFNVYTSQMFAFALNPATNQSVDIARFSVPDPPSGFVMSSSDTEVAKQFTYDTDDGPKTVEIKSRMLTIGVRYSTFALALTACMFITNWILTLASLCIAFSAMAKGKVTWSALILHSTMILVIPSIRNLYLCPPPFGTFIGAV